MDKKASVKFRTITLIFFALIILSATSVIALQEKQETTTSWIVAQSFDTGTLLVEKNSSTAVPNETDLQNTKKALNG